MTRKLDALIAEHIMGFVRVTCDTYPPAEGAILIPSNDGLYQSPPWRLADDNTPLGKWALLSVPHYSTQIAAAWGVIERMREDTYIFTLNAGSDGWDADIYCPFGPCEKHGHTSTVLGHGGQSYDEATAPLAIVTAALLAVGVSQDTINEAMGA